MNWRDAPIPLTDEGVPMFLGSIDLLNDKNDLLASIVWFDDDGPFYAHAMDVNDTTIIRRIGPISTLEGAKQACVDAIEGRKDISNRAG